MKKFLLLLFSLIIFIGCSEEEEKPIVVQETFDLLDLDSLMNTVVKNPSGKLKSKNITFQNNKSFEDFYYNIAGDSILTIKTYGSKIKYTYSVHHYDVQGHIIYSKNYYEDNGLLKYWNSTEYSYTDFNQIASISIGRNDKSIQILEFTYDEKERMIKMIGRLPFGGDKLEMVYETPESKKMVKENFYWDRTSEVPYYSYQINYDEKGRIFSKTAYEGENKEVYKYFYDGNGRIIEQVFYDLHFGQQEFGRVNFTYYD